MPTLKSFFQDMEVVTPKEGLEKEIFQAVLAVRDRRLKQRLQVASLGIAFSLGTLLYAGFALGKTLLESDFWSIVALIFSDVTVAAQYWNDFLFSLLETFPTLSVVAVLLPVFIFLLFLDMYAGVQRKNYSFNH